MGLSCSPEDRCLLFDFDEDTLTDNDCDDFELSGVGVDE